MSETLNALCEKWERQQNIQGASITVDASLQSFAARKLCAAELRAILPDVERLIEALSWALDMLDMYDEFLIKLGEPREKVYSPIHLQGKEKARAALALFDQPVAPKETKT